MFEIGFLCPKPGKKWKREDLGEKKTGFKAEEIDSKQIIF